MTDPRALRALVVACAALASVAAARFVRAAATVVAIASPSLDRRADELVNRIRGELVADGFLVVAIGAASEENRVTVLTRLGRERGAAVVVGVFVSDDGNAIVVCVVDQTTGRVLERRLEAKPGSPEHSPAIFARRVVDFVRASIVDILVVSLQSLASPARAQPKPQSPTPEASQPMASARWDLEGGLGLLASFEGAPPSIAPLARLRLSLSETFQLRALVAWLGTQPRLQAPTGTGSATIEQGVATVDCLARPWQGGWIRPYASLGVGTYFVAVNGDGAARFSGERGSVFAFALDGGLGASAPLGSRLELSLEAQALLAWPGIAIRFADFVAARVGRPSVLGVLSIGGWI